MRLLLFSGLTKEDTLSCFFPDPVQCLWRALPARKIIDSLVCCQEDWRLDATKNRLNGSIVEICGSILDRENSRFAGTNLLKDSVMRTRGPRCFLGFGITLSPRHSLRILLSRNKGFFCSFREHTQSRRFKLSATRTVLNSNFHKGCHAKLFCQVECICNFSSAHASSLVEELECPVKQQ